MTQKDDDSFRNKSFPEWNNLYASEATISSLPWYNTNLDDDLREQLRKSNITKGSKFLDLGTGPATQAIELSKLGFKVTATDISENAIVRAKRMSKDIEFIVDDILDSELKDDTFDYIFDRGCFHVLASLSRQRYVGQVSRTLKDTGLLFKTFSVSEPSTEGPYKFSFEMIRSIFGKEFEIDYSKETVYQGTLDMLPTALFGVLRKKRMMSKALE
jgi:ubiquinone/menaquinone biosynthesis C-methylase UbiE